MAIDGIPGIKDLISGGIKGIGDTFANIVEKFKADPTKVAELQADLERAKLDASIKAEELANQIESTYAQELETVNSTMREEDKSEHWLVWSWRPLVGYCFILMVVNNYVLLPYFKKVGLVSIAIPSEIIYTMMTILGVASAGRVLTNWQKAKNS